MSDIVEACRRSELDGLKAMRDKLAADMDAASPAVVAQIAGRLDVVLARISSIEKAQPQGGTRILELVNGDGSGRGAGAKRRASPGRNRDKRTG